MKRLIAVLLVCSSLVMAGETSVHWSDLSRVIGGKEVVVRLAEGKQMKGSAVSIEGESLVIETGKGRRESIPRSSLREIRLSRKVGYKWRLVGTAIGAGIGIAASLPVLRETHNEGSSRYDAVAAGLIGGLAVLGYLAGWSADKKGELIRVLPD